MSYTSFTYETDAARDCVIYTFATGIKLTSQCVGGIGSVEYPAVDDLGSISYPVRHTGEVFHALRNGANVATLPQRCKAW
jgi:hypothetical protein